MTQQSKQYSYAGNKRAYQVFYSNLFISLGRIIRIWLRNEDLNLPVPTKDAHLMVLFEVTS